MDYILLGGGVAILIVWIVYFVNQNKISKENSRYLQDCKLIATQICNNLYVDENNRKWWINSYMSGLEIRDYEDILDFELVEDGVQYKTKGGITRAVVGGALFGVAGAIVGASTAKQHTSVSDLHIVIYLKNGETEKIKLIETKIDTNSYAYKSAKEDAETITAMIINMQSQSRQEVSNIVETNNFSSADEIRKYKELLDEGIISQEEFDQKKKQLLNL